MHGFTIKKNFYYYCCIEAIVETGCHILGWTEEGFSRLYLKEPKGGIIFRDKIFAKYVGLVFGMISRETDSLHFEALVVKFTSMVWNEWTILEGAV